MNFDKLLAFLFGKKGLCLLLAVALSCLIFATSCSIMDCFEDEDIEYVCGNWDCDDCLMLVFCGCISPEYICNFVSCTCNNACEGVESCRDDCNEAVSNSIEEACDSCEPSTDDQTEGIMDCYSCFYDCVLGIDKNKTCPGCGLQFNIKQAHEAYGSLFCPECFEYLGPA